MGYIDNTTFYTKSLIPRYCAAVSKFFMFKEMYENLTNIIDENLRCLVKHFKFFVFNLNMFTVNLIKTEPMVCF